LVEFNEFRIIRINFASLEVYLDIVIEPVDHRQLTALRQVVLSEEYH
jgi:hypothetical protein